MYVLHGPVSWSDRADSRHLLLPIRIARTNIGGAAPLKTRETKTHHSAKVFISIINMFFSGDDKVGVVVVRGKKWALKVRDEAMPIQLFFLSCSSRWLFPITNAHIFSFGKIIYFLRRAATLLATAAVVAVILFLQVKKGICAKKWGYKFLLLSAGVTSVILLLSFKYSPKNVGFWLTREILPLSMDIHVN